MLHNVDEVRTNHTHTVGYRTQPLAIKPNASSLRGQMCGTLISVLVRVCACVCNPRCRSLTYPTTLVVEPRSPSSLRSTLTDEASTWQASAPQWPARSRSELVFTHGQRRRASLWSLLGASRTDTTPHRNGVRVRLAPRIRRPPHGRRLRTTTSSPKATVVPPKSLAPASRLQHVYGATSPMTKNNSRLSLAGALASALSRPTSAPPSSPGCARRTLRSISCTSRR